MFIYLHKKGQSTLEYSIIIAVIVAALIVMQIYIKRGVQGKMKSATDDIGDQYSPDFTTGNISTNSTANSHETIGGGSTTTNSTQNQTRNANENISPLSGEAIP